MSIVDDLTPKIEIFSMWVHLLNSALWKWHLLVLMCVLFCLILRPLQFLSGYQIWEFLAYSYTSWPPWPHPGVCFSSALSWHFDRRLTLPLLTGKVCIVIINSWSLDISGCMLQISHYTGACNGAESANLKAFSLRLGPLSTPHHIYSQGLLEPFSKAKELLCMALLRAVRTYLP